MKLFNRGALPSSLSASRLGILLNKPNRPKLSDKLLQFVKGKDLTPNILIREHFPSDRNATILDLGCGHGALVYFARKAGYSNVTGVDASPEQVAEAQRLSIGGIKQGDLMAELQTLRDNSQDMVIAFDVIEHFTKNEIVSFVDEVYRALRKGGKWIIHTPNAESPFGGRMRYWDFTHELAFTRTSITQLLKSSGFSLVTCHEDTPIPHGLKSTVRSLLWKVIRGALRLYLAAETGAGEKACIFSQNFLTVAVKLEAQSLKLEAQS